MFRKRVAGVIASAVIAVGLMSPVASAQSERIIAPEDRDDYVAEFYVDPDNPPMIEGTPTLTEAEIEEYRDKILQAEASGPPQDEVVPGEMWSDKVGLPEGVNKAKADQSEVALAREQSQPRTMSLQTTSTRCQTYWLVPQVCGAILDRYEQLGGLTSWLAFPIAPMSPNPDGQGQRQRFAGGFIYWHPETGAHAVPNITVPVWERNGWEAGWLGYPLGKEVPVQGSNPVDGEINGWVQIFQGGRIYRTPVLQGLQVASINGVILDKWLELGGPNSDLGFPIADEAATADGIGRFSVFQQGTIYWHPNVGAHVVSGDVGGIVSKLAEYSVPKKQIDSLLEKLERGELWNSMTEGAVPVATESHSSSEKDLTIKRYGDGSIQVNEMENAFEVPSGPQVMREITECHYTEIPATFYYPAMTTYKNCKASASTILMELSFMFDRVAVDGTSSLHNIGREEWQCVMCVASNPRYDQPDPATARLSVDWQQGIGNFSRSGVGWVQVNSSGKDAWITAND